MNTRIQESLNFYILGNFLVSIFSFLFFGISPTTIYITKFRGFLKKKKKKGSYVIHILDPMKVKSYSLHLFQFRIKSTLVQII